MDKQLNLEIEKRMSRTEQKEKTRGAWLGDTCQQMPTPKKGCGGLRWKKTLFYYYR